MKKFKKHIHPPRLSFLLRRLRKMNKIVLSNKKQSIKTIQTSYKNNQALRYAVALMLTLRQKYPYSFKKDGQRVFER